MAEVGKPRETRAPRLPMGPPIAKPTNGTAVLEEEDDKVLDPEINIEDNKDNKDNKDNFEEIKRAKIPIPPTTHFKPNASDDFFKWEYSLQPEHWLQILWYFYRTDPKIIRPKDQFYIDCGNYPINEEWILRTHGSGEYFIIFNDHGKPKNAKKICQANFKINHLDYPPVVKPDELDVFYSGNKTIVDRFIAEGKLTVDRKPMNATQGLGNDAVVGLLGKMIDRLDRTQINSLKDPKDNAINTAIEIMAKGNQAATQMMLDQMKQDDPEKLVKLMTLMMSMIPKPVEHKDEGSSYLKLFMDSQTKSLELLSKKDETIMQLMTKMFEAKLPTNNEDSFDKSLDRFTKLFELTGMLGGNLGGGKKSTLETVMQYTMPVAEKAFGVIQNLLAVRAQAENIKNGKGGKTELVVSTASPQVNKVEGDEEIEEVQEPNTNTNTNKDVRQVMQQSNEEQLMMITQGLKQIGPKIIEALDRKTSGSAFAEGIENFMGPAVYDQLAWLGKNKIIEIIKSDTNLWNLITTTSVKFPHRTEKNFIGFIEDFIAYGSDEIEPPEVSTSQGANKENKMGVIDEVVE